jgi:hypothetical protein
LYTIIFFLISITITNCSPSLLMTMTDDKHKPPSI